MSRSNLASTTVAEQSAEALETLRGYLRERPPSSPDARMRLLSEADGREPQIAVPVEALALFLEVLEQLAQGHAVKVASESPELALYEAAAILNVPEPFLDGLLDDGAFPYRRVKSERRVRLADVLSYKQRDLFGRRRIAAELTAESQEMGLYD